MKKGGLGSRLIVAGWGIPFLLGLTWLGGWWTVGLISLISLFALDEYYKLQTALGYKPARIFGLPASILLVISWSIGGSTTVWILISVFLVTAMSGTLIGISTKEIAATVTGLLYIPVLAGCFISLRDWTGNGNIESEGRWLAFCVWGAIWVGDTFAYMGGRLFGKRKLAPAISPNKTVEGFVFGFLGAVLFAIFWYWLDLVYLDIALAIGLAAGLFGQIGDLVESKIKREAGVKDTGTLLPGHGGILDRFDSLLATAPIVAMYLILRTYFI